MKPPVPKCFTTPPQTSRNQYVLNSCSFLLPAPAPSDHLSILYSCPFGFSALEYLHRSCRRWGRSRLPTQQGTPRTLGSCMTWGGDRCLTDWPTQISQEMTFSSLVIFLALKSILISIVIPAFFFLFQVWAWCMFSCSLMFYLFVYMKSFSCKWYVVGLASLTILTTFDFKKRFYVFIHPRE